MPAVNVAAEIEIRRPTDVASVMFDPQREPDWMSAVKTVELVDKGIKPGARVARELSSDRTSPDDGRRSLSLSARVDAEDRRRAFAAPCHLRPAMGMDRF
jgi:hypothetical protein